MPITKIGGISPQCAFLCCPRTLPSGIIGQTQFAAKLRGSRGAKRSAETGADEAIGNYRAAVNCGHLGEAGGIGTLL
jgi:hypothetical protein